MLKFLFSTQGVALGCHSSRLQARNPMLSRKLYQADKQILLELANRTGGAFLQPCGFGHRYEMGWLCSKIQLLFQVKLARIGILPTAEERNWLPLG